MILCVAMNREVYMQMKEYFERHKDEYGDRSFPEFLLDLANQKWLELLEKERNE